MCGHIYHTETQHQSYNRALWLNGPAPRTAPDCLKLRGRSTIFHNTPNIFTFCDACWCDFQEPNDLCKYGHNKGRNVQLFPDDEPQCVFAYFALFCKYAHNQYIWIRPDSLSQSWSSLGPGFFGTLHFLEREPSEYENIRFFLEGGGVSEQHLFWISVLPRHMSIQGIIGSKCLTTVQTCHTYVGNVVSFNMPCHIGPSVRLVGTIRAAKCDLVQLRNFSKHNFPHFIITGAWKSYFIEQYIWINAVLFNIFVRSTGVFSQGFPSGTDFSTQTTLDAKWRHVTRFDVVSHVSAALRAITAFCALETKPFWVHRHLGLDQIIQLLKSA